MVSRRAFIRSVAAASLAVSMPRLAFANSVKPANRFVLLILRGGMDGLAAIPAMGDPGYRAMRGVLALENALDLDGYFALHPDLVAMHGLYRDKQLIAIQGTAPPYDKRSHFDAQNVLETGIAPPHSVSSGWLYRSLAGVDARKPPDKVAMAFGTSVPLVLQGEHTVGSWAPDNLPPPNDDTMSRVMALYSKDKVLGPALTSMIETQSMVGSMGAMNRANPDQLGILAKAAGKLLGHPEGPQVAVLEATGWDTHTNQGADKGQLATRFGQLDTALAQLRESLGDTWSRTVVLAVTEFGRTVAVNGTRGTDHGVGGAGFLLGGAVAGGRVLAHFNGLKQSALYQARDLPPAIDHRSLHKAVLIDHLGVDPGFVADIVFPKSGDAAPIRGLFRDTGSRVNRLT
ncbi:MAG TPA: DUF1501 domain-containing protein [Pseudomonadales bacterium]|nr:DUF1501 domain-containing protein [Pseudomonadales bacterium]